MRVKRFLTCVRLYKDVGLHQIGAAFATVLGLLWLVVEPIGWLWPNALEGLPVNGVLLYSILIVVALIIALVWRHPPCTSNKRLSSPDSTIEIKVGDLFDVDTHLVIGFNDVFDTELGEVVKPDSIQGQFLTRVYGSDQASLDAHICEALAESHHTPERDPDKTRGKNLRYPVGTVVSLGSPKKRYFLSAYGYMGSDLKCTSTGDELWQSMSKLWEEVRLKGQGRPVSTAVIGSDLSRTSLPHTFLAKLIVMSFIVASKKEVVTSKLSIVIYPDDLNSVNLYELKEFLNSVCF